MPVRHSGAAPFACHSERSEESPHWPLPLPVLRLSFRSAAEESASALAVVCSPPLPVIAVILSASFEREGSRYRPRPPPRAVLPAVPICLPFRSSMRVVIPLPRRHSGAARISVLALAPACSPPPPIRCHPERVFRARRIPIPLVPPSTVHPVLPQHFRPCCCLFYVCHFRRKSAPRIEQTPNLRIERWASVVVITGEYLGFLRAVNS